MGREELTPVAPAPLTVAWFSHQTVFPEIDGIQFNSKVLLVFLFFFFFFIYSGLVMIVEDRHNLVSI